MPGICWLAHAKGDKSMGRTGVGTCVGHGDIVQSDNSGYVSCISCEGGTGADASKRSRYL